MNAAALAELGRCCPQTTFLTTAELVAPYLVDERALFHGRALAVALPETTAAVSELMHFCYAHEIPMVPQGGNTGYCGGATPDTSGAALIISLSRLNRIRGINPSSFTLTTEAGLTLAHVQQAAAKHQLLFPLSMGSEASCQIGGNLSTNAGGVAVLRYGMARDLVLGLEVVLPNGEIWDGLTALRKDNTGYDIKQLFLGAEGTLGVITAAVLKLYPASTQRETAWLAVADLPAASALLGLARRLLNDCVTSFEYLSLTALELVLAQVPETRNPFAERHAHHVLLEVSASGESIDLRGGLLALFEAAQREHLVLDAVLAETLAQRTDFWRLREKIPVAERAAGGSVKHDVAVMLASVPELAERASRAVLAKFPTVRLSLYGHLGDGNLHFNILAPATEDAMAFRTRNAEQLSKLVHATAAELNGSFSAEHGVGQLKRGLLAATKSPVALRLMRQIKQTLDPKGLMNPGKVL